MLKVGHKDDRGKADVTLLCWESIEGAAYARMEGGMDYGTFNYQKGMTFRRIMGACFRHLGAILRGEDTDPKSGLPHVDHLAAEVNMLGWLMRNRKDLDDRADGKGGQRNPALPDVLYEMGAARRKAREEAASMGAVPGTTG